ncbi:MAG: hypothetical protein II330_00310, partial [Clostridia bacterium]|nr:hypothetical protein [Clostridia bacterium]
EYGAQRTPTAQWTVTGASAFILGRCDHTDPSHARVSQAMPAFRSKWGFVTLPIWALPWRLLRWIPWSVI